MRINTLISHLRQNQDVIRNSLLTVSRLMNRAEADEGGSVEGSTVVELVDSVRVEPASDRRSVACISGN